MQDQERLPIQGRVEFYRYNRHWHVLMYGPKPVMIELHQEINERGLFVLNHGGGMDGATWSMLIGTSVGGSNPYQPRPLKPGRLARLVGFVRQRLKARR